MNPCLWFLVLQEFGVLQTLGPRNQKFPMWFRGKAPLGAFTVGSVALLVARRTNDRKVAGSRPTKAVCITVSTGNRLGVNCPLWPAATPSSEEVGV